MTKPSEIVQLLLNDEQLASLDQSGGLAAATQQAGKGKKAERKDGGNGGMGDFWDEEGDDFFGAGGNAGANASGVAGDKGDDEAATPTVPVKKQRKSKATGAPRGRKPKKKDATGPHEVVMEM